MTENYIIIPEFPLCIAGTGIDIMVHGAVISSLSWEKDRPTYLHIVRRRLEPKEQGNGHIATIPVPGFFTFHTANAFESINENNETILNLDCCAYPTGDILFKVHALSSDPKNDIIKEKNKETSHNGINDAAHSSDTFGELRRYTLNLTKKKQEAITTAITNMEFPRFNQDYLFKNYKYVYGTQHLSLPSADTVEQGVVKVNVTDNSYVTFQKHGYAFSEPVFVQRPSADTEDDGVILTLGNTADCCYIVIVDAATMKELACFTIGEFKSSSLHGSFVDYEFKPININ
jgi:torulene dioxygenase